MPVAKPKSEHTCLETGLALFLSPFLSITVEDPSVLHTVKTQLATVRLQFSDPKQIHLEQKNKKASLNEQNFVNLMFIVVFYFKILFWYISTIILVINNNNNTDGVSSALLWLSEYVLGWLVVCFQSWHCIVCPLYMTGSPVFSWWSFCFSLKIKSVYLKEWCTFHFSSSSRDWSPIKRSGHDFW